jgi:hypothetical protein
MTLLGFRAFWMACSSSSLGIGRILPELWLCPAMRYSISKVDMPYMPCFAEGDGSKPCDPSHMEGSISYFGAWILIKKCRTARPSFFWNVSEDSTSKSRRVRSNTWLWRLWDLRGSRHRKWFSQLIDTLTNKMLQKLAKTLLDMRLTMINTNSWWFMRV